MRISISAASKALKSGQVVAVPTETVYGLAACLDCPAAIQQIFILKGRPLNNPLIIHVADRQDMDAYVSHYPPGMTSFSRKLLARIVDDYSAGKP